MSFHATILARPDVILGDAGESRPVAALTIPVARALSPVVGRRLYL